MWLNEPLGNVRVDVRVLIALHIFSDLRPSLASMPPPLVESAEIRKAPYRY
jgi:hypothetical protein